MSGISGLLLGIGLPWLAMILLLEWLAGRGAAAQTGRAWRMAVAYLLSMLMTAGLLVLLQHIGSSFHPAWILAFWLAVLIVSLVGFWRLRMKGRTGKPASAMASPSWWEKVAIALLLLLIVIRLAGLTIENWHQPMSAWDAWLVWGERAKLWFESQQLIPFGSPEQWLRVADPHFYTTNGWEYPRAISLVQLWAALSLGRWDDALVTLPWLPLVVALGLSLYGGLRMTGVSAWLALAAVWVLVSLPLLDAHVALAGYADLWLALAFSVGLFGLLSWVRLRDRWLLMLALLALALMPVIKGQPAWMLFPVTLPALLWLLPNRLRVVLPVLVVAALVTVLILAGGELNMGGLGKLSVSSQGLVLPVLGVVSPDFARLGSSSVPFILGQDSWHMLWGMTLLAVTVLLWRDWRDPMTQAMLLTLLAATVIYVLSYASPRLLSVISNGTVVNRGLLYLAPLAVFVMIHALGPVRQVVRASSASLDRAASTE